MFTLEDIRRLYQEEGENGNRLVNSFDCLAYQLIAKVITSAMIGSKQEVVDYDCGFDVAEKTGRILQKLGFPFLIRSENQRIDLVIPAFWTQ